MVFRMRLCISLYLKFFLFIFVFFLILLIVFTLSLVFHKNFETVVEGNLSFFIRNAISYTAKELDVRLRNIERRVIYAYDTTS